MATSMWLRKTQCLRRNFQNYVILAPRVQQDISHSSNNSHCKYCAIPYMTNNIKTKSTWNSNIAPAPTLRLNTREFCNNPISSPVDETTEKLSREQLSYLCNHILKELNTSNTELRLIAQYHFDGKGKAFRPMLVVLMSKACNFHLNRGNRSILDSQYRLAMITEMIHTASLIHDDVIDASQTRRGKPSVCKVWGEKKAILAGDYVLSVASNALARLGNEDVILVLTQVIEDLVRGELMQLRSKEDVNERFTHYLLKTYKKTASLIANSCKAAAILGNSPDNICEVAYTFGRNIGMAFQLIDDVLDFVSCSTIMGKPTTADLKLGLATAPVLFAADKFPELHEMIMRRFNQAGDVEKARLAVQESDGIEQTRFLAQQHCDEAVRQIELLKSSPEQVSLIRLAEFVISRIK